MLRGTPRGWRGVIGPGSCDEPGLMTQNEPGLMALANEPGPMTTIGPGSTLNRDRWSEPMREFLLVRASFPLRARVEMANQIVPHLAGLTMIRDGNANDKL